MTAENAEINELHLAETELGAVDLPDALPRSIEGYDLDRERARAQRLPIDDLRRRRSERPLLVARAGGGIPAQERADAEARRAVGELRARFDRHVVGGAFRVAARDGRIVRESTNLAGPYCLAPGDVTLDATAGDGRSLFSDDHPTIVRVARSLAERGSVGRRLRERGALVEASVAFAERLAEAVGGELGGDPFRVLPVRDEAEAALALLRLGSARCVERVRSAHGDDAVRALARELGVEAPGPDGIARTGAAPLARLLLLPGAARPGFGGVTVRPDGHAPGEVARAVAAAVDRRPLPELLATPGRLAASLADGRVPAELIAAVLVPAFDGERAARLAERGTAVAVWDAVADDGIPVALDESWTFARCGRLLDGAAQHVEADAVIVGRGQPLAALATRRALSAPPPSRASVAADLAAWPREADADVGLLEVGVAGAGLDAILFDRDPVLDGLSYVENARVKGRYLAATLEELSRRHPDAVLEVDGHGLIAALRVRGPARVAAACRRRGVILVAPAAATGDADEGWLGVVLPLDVLGAEVEDLGMAIDAALLDVAAGRAP